MSDRYPYLLAMYLGDGHITMRRRGVQFVTISCANVPQHGPGPKHLRTIALEAWQQEIVDRESGRFLRGLFHSDGCRITNWAPRRVRGGGPTRYVYPRYLFCDKSTDILDLCAAGLRRLGIAHTRPRPDTISVARREAVAAVDLFVGPKS